MTLHLQYDPGLGLNGNPRLIGLKLHFSAEEETPLAAVMIAWTIKIFHSKLSAFPHLQVVELHFKSLSHLRHAIEISPEISQLPVLGHQILYGWGCHRSQFPHLDTAGCHIVGVDPTTLQPNGTSTN